LAFAISGLAAFSVVGSGGCSTDAVGIGVCREIEDVRCEAAAACGIDGAADVEACKRFYRDHCLHGLGVEDEPRSSEVKRCKAAIKAAGECGKAGLSEPASCPALSGVQLSEGIVTTCDVVLQPENSSACRFLVPDEDPIPDAGAGGASGGSAGAAGAATGGGGATGGAATGGAGGGAGTAGAGN